MNLARLVPVFALAALAGCDLFAGPFHTPWHPEKLASGTTIKVTSFNLVWGAEHDEHTLGHDCFAIEYVSEHADDEQALGAEAVEVFELVRPASEQWGFGEATVAAIPTLDHRGPYDLFWFRRQADGHWTQKTISLKGKWLPNALSDAQ